MQQNDIFQDMKIVIVTSTKCHLSLKTKETIYHRHVEFQLVKHLSIDKGSRCVLRCTYILLTSLMAFVL